VRWRLHSRAGFSRARTGSYRVRGDSHEVTMGPGINRTGQGAGTGDQPDQGPRSNASPSSSTPGRPDRDRSTPRREARAGDGPPGDHGGSIAGRRDLPNPRSLDPPGRYPISLASYVFSSIAYSHRMTGAGATPADDGGRTDASPVHLGGRPLSRIPAEEAGDHRRDD
jgi:hypothetical protein